MGKLGVGEGVAVSLAFLWFAAFTATSLAGGVVYLFGRFPKPETPAEEQQPDRVVFTGQGALEPSHTT